MLSFSLIIIIFSYFPKLYTFSMENDLNLLTHYISELNVNPDLEQQLKTKIAQKRKSEDKLKKLNKQIANDTEYFEEIPHFAVNSFKRIKGKKSSIENAFKNIIGMIGVKYTYKRDADWRTWREIRYPDKKEVVCYRCQNIVNLNETNCKYCQQGGYWIIEEKQPKCSFEIFSFKNNNELCIAHFWQLNKANLSSCPAVMPLNELSDCGMPMITKYIVNRDYSKNISERTLPAICKRRERCEFSTVYVVNPENIVFRIINTTNNIIYSRIMKRNRKQYVCVDNCGIFNFDTATASRKEDHLILNLLHTNKKKRDNLPIKKLKVTRHKLKRPLHSNKNAFSKNSLLHYKKNYSFEKMDREQLNTSIRPSMCKQILNKELNSDSND